jgi:hypothetical protein
LQNTGFSLVARNAAGQILATAAAGVALVHADGGQPLELVVGKVAGAGAREIDVLHDGQPIAEDHASSSAPSVTILTPRRNSRVGGTASDMIRWRSRDPGGKALQATVRYSADGGRSWDTIFIGPDHGQARLPARLLTTSRNARVRVYVSDGFDAAIATSQRFTSLGARPIVSIDSPTSETRVLGGAGLDLEGSAWDDTNTELRGRALVWRAGRHLLGHGTSVNTFALGPGRYRITLSARDRHGRVAAASAPVTILPSMPIVKQLRAPHRISARARTVAISLSTLAPAKLAVGRIRAPVSRSPKRVRLPIRPGRSPLTIVLALRSGPYVTRIAVTIAR